MSKTSGHFVTQFQMRAKYLCESKLASGEGSVALVTLWNGITVAAAQIAALAERGGTR